MEEFPELTKSLKLNIYEAFCSYGSMSANDPMQRCYDATEGYQWRKCITCWVNDAIRSKTDVILSYEAIFAIVQEVYQQKLNQHRNNAYASFY